METSFSTQDIFAGKHDAIILFTYADRSPVEQKFDEKFQKAVAVARDRNEFSGKPEETVLHVQRDSPRFAVIVGLGPKTGVSYGKMRKAAGMSARMLQERGAKTIAIEIPRELDAATATQAVTEGAILSLYKFTKYKTLKLEDIKRTKTLTIVSDRTGVAAKNGTDIGRSIAESVNMARDLQNTMPGEMTPAAMADAASKVAKQEKFKIKILDKKGLEKADFGGILAVGGGAVNDPRLVTMEYAPKGAKRTVAVVGKGVTFDTGGLSIKPSSSMLGMKFDMSGASAVLGIMRSVSRLKLPIRVIGIMGLAENAISGDAYRPDDVVKTKSGKTIEVQNTDAEGRIVLADSLYHATTFKPDLIIDLATLTGAALVALGDVAAAVLGTDQKSIDKLLKAGYSSGERIWQLPLWSEYEKDIDSSVADMKNMGVPKLAGTIAGAVLLKQFVGDTPWVHLDIAGVAWADPRSVYFTRKGDGGTGFGVRLVTEFLRS
ncbi:leucyl aminopeptidase [Candidatus Woesearchaeota archaeon]|nr:leucyl aminopeptidase [Candidatus Woesearchaeota archaeon]